ncbi:MULTISPECIES: BolA family protein [unclassified Oleiphilus]|jgi:acid stress-induced BolA-like protein IbaG/YrbA|uniref:BolA family protein n=1 Tax=unclassified Oleiphilus TaxID=2631174 RepID=UPI0007C22932|nr:MULTISPECIES: BolA/IbaG family iron-sulfur metabolism protein [unclassified Oleiphilus]KZY42392.1 cell division protein BolA [Oleiphilus sp. HI0050]KZY72369.1 cell division protein BolA [Oleiphilus sp. HI0068]KZY80887.1 cell division protein BolA [Oleiphilus sp. HI0069]KZY87530.1 cell division protein BolA [Oleiphilus sp. HI0072]KZZ18248.1 cell division protein BolA [Oleiphilus sp. HI0078]KZZ22729.1 cell division protein BolA [Oleiphilus sp. HI0081]KZZ30784.1 cell division protein BolA [O
MQASEVEKLILDQMDDVEVRVESDGYHYQVTAIGEVFAGLSPVKKQQLIYACLNKYIIDGTIHAVIIKTYTPQEWAEKA